MACAVLSGGACGRREGVWKVQDEVRVVQHSLMEKITLKTHMYIAKISSGRYNEYGFMAAKTDSWTDLRKE